MQANDHTGTEPSSTESSTESSSTGSNSTAASPPAADGVEQSDSAARHERQRTLWARFVAGVLPAPNPDRLVRVAETSRASVPFVEDCLADAEILSIVHEIPGLWGAEPSFEILVSARDRSIARSVVSGL